MKGRNSGVWKGEELQYAEGFKRILLAVNVLQPDIRATAEDPLRI